MFFCATCEGMARTRGKRARVKTKIMMKRRVEGVWAKWGLKAHWRGWNERARGVVGTPGGFLCPALPCPHWIGVTLCSIAECPLTKTQRSQADKNYLCENFMHWIFCLPNFWVSTIFLRLESNFQQIMWAGRVELKVRRQWVRSGGWPFVPLASCSCMSLAENRPTYQLSLSQRVKSCKIEQYQNVPWGVFFSLAISRSTYKIYETYYFISQWGRIGRCF